MGSEDLMFAEIAVECEGDRWVYGGNWGSRRFICPIVLRVVFHPLRWDESIRDGCLSREGGMVLRRWWGTSELDA
jgi:hypothetical protein